MKKLSLRTTAMVALIAMLAFPSVIPAVAQDTATPRADLVDPVALYGRLYAANPDDLFPEATPGAEPAATPPLVAVVQAYEYESDEDAESSFESVNQVFIEQISSSSNAEFEVVDVDDLGDEAVQSTGTIDASGFEVPLTTMLVRQDNIIFMAATGTLDESSGEAAGAFMDHMLNAEVSDSTVEFNADGTSTGGIFDVFPSEGDDVMRGMTISADTFAKADSATPES